MCALQNLPVSPTILPILVHQDWQCELNGLQVWKQILSVSEWVTQAKDVVCMEKTPVFVRIGDWICSKGI